MIELLVSTALNTYTPVIVERSESRTCVIEEVIEAPDKGWSSIDFSKNRFGKKTKTTTIVCY